MKNLEYPRIWFSQEAGKRFAPWEHFKVDGVLMNAYDFMQHPRILDQVQKNGIHEYLNFKGPIIMDSGGFLFMKKKNVPVDAEKIISFYEETKPNFGVALDHPMIPTLTNNEIRRRQAKTLKNTKIMLEQKITKNPVLIPVIHGFNEKQIKWYVKKLEKIAKFPLYGVGSLVPSLFNIDGVGGILNVTKIISQVRKHFQNSKLHIFGTGSALTMHLMFYAGADSLDTSAWRTKAAFGAIQMSGMGDRWISNASRKKPYPILSKKEKQKLENCKCPACRKFGFKGLKTEFDNRASHNAWIYQKEVEKARKLIKQNQYEQYVEKIMKNTNFNLLFQKIKKLKS